MKNKKMIRRLHMNYNVVAAEYDGFTITVVLKYRTPVHPYTLAFTTDLKMRYTCECFDEQLNDLELTDVHINFVEGLVKYMVKRVYKCKDPLKHIRVQREI